MCMVNKHVVRDLAGREADTFDLEHLEMRSLAQFSYLEPGKTCLMFEMKVKMDHTSSFGFFLQFSLPVLILRMVISHFALVFLVCYSLKPAH